jgi:hypothetical protein
MQACTRNARARERADLATQIPSRVQGVDSLVRFLLAIGSVQSLSVDDSLCDSADHANVAKLKGCGVISGAYHAAVFELL